MKRSYSVFLRSLVVLALASTAVWANDPKAVPDQVGDPTFAPAANCDLTGYKSEVQTVGRAIPDNSAAGTTMGPIIVPADGNTIADVVIDITMSHTWIGDVIAVVGYDETCDGTVDAQSVVICRPRGSQVASPTPCGTGACCGCSSNFLNAALLFDDTAAATLPDGVACLSATNVPGGCYRPSPQGGTPLAVFDGLRKGGCWYLNASDHAGLDTGTVTSWSVHIKNNTVGVEETNWSQVKRLYN